MRILLASSSPRRRELLRMFGLSFETVEPSGVDESAVGGNTAERCLRLATLKARRGLEIAATGPETAGPTISIGADTLVVLDIAGKESPLGKPAGREEARRMLRALSGRTHRILTGVSVAGSDGRMVSGIEESRVVFRDLDEQAMERHLDSGDAEGKAGAYGIQSEGALLVAGFRGCYYNIVGLPLMLLARLLPPELGIAFSCDCEQRPLQCGRRGCREARA